MWIFWKFVPKSKLQFVTFTAIWLTEIIFRFPHCVFVKVQIGSIDVRQKGICYLLKLQSCKKSWLQNQSIDENYLRKKRVHFLITKANLYLFWDNFFHVLIEHWESCSQNVTKSLMETLHFSFGQLLQYESLLKVEMNFICLLTK